jgi:hypothetical protein
VKQSLGYTVGVVIVVDMLMVATMFASPEEHGVLKCRRTKDQGKQPDEPVRLKSAMGEEPVITERHGKSAREKHYKKQYDLKGVQAEKPEINRHGGDR